MSTTKPLPVKDIFLKPVSPDWGSLTRCPTGPSNAYMCRALHSRQKIRD